jgi:transposase-like protein
MFKKKTQSPITVAMEMTCTVCTHGMEVVRVHPSAAKLPEMHTYRCTQCGTLRTVEVQIAAARAA